MTENKTSIDYSNPMAELTLEQVQEILSTTIKYDDAMKTILFLSLLLTYTDDEQVNCYLTGESSSGKTYDVIEALWYFPKEDIMDYHGASPTSFFHSPDVVWTDEHLNPIDFSLKPSKFDSAEKKQAWRDLLSKAILLRDLRRKIVVFLDMPHNKLIENLRGVLSHDKEICYYSITDRAERSGFRTKRVGVKGYFTCVFCTANAFMDLQEATRNFILSPETSQEKIKACLDLDDRRDSDINFNHWKNSDPSRLFLKNRVQIIRERKVSKIMMDEGLELKLREWYDKQLLYGYKPKDNRDMPRLKALAKAWALLNFENRKIYPTIVGDFRELVYYIDEKDVDVAIKLYSTIIKSNELGLSPEAFEVWENVVKPILSENVGITVKDVHKSYWSKNHRQIADRRLRDMMKQFAQAGLCTEQKEGKELHYYAIPQDPKPEPQAQETKIDNFQGEQ
jgi:hypothetical protein